MCTIVVDGCMVMVYVRGTWPRMWEYNTKDEARASVFKIRAQKNINIIVWR